MILINSSFMAFIVFFLFAALLFWLAGKFNAPLRNYFLTGGFYFALVSSLPLVLILGYAIDAPPTCEWVVNETHTDDNETSHGQFPSSHTDTEYEYTNTCTDVDKTATENLYIFYITNIFLLSMAAIIGFFYWIYKLVREGF